MPVILEESLKEINNLVNLIKEARDRGENVAALEAQLEMLQANFNAQRAPLTSKKMLTD